MTKTATQAITVNAATKTLSSIAVTTAPTKVTYTAGEYFNTSGMVVTATYSDSSTKAVTSYTFAPTEALTTGDTSITISYTEGGVTKTATQAITVNAKPISGGGGYIPPVQKPTIEAGEGVKVTLSSDGTVATITVEAGYDLADVVLNGTSKGKVTEVKGLKTGDKLAVTATKKATEPTKEDIIAIIESQQLVARSKVTTSPNGKKAILITWYDKNGNEVTFDGVEIFRSTKRNSGYGTKPIFTSVTGKYYNTAVKAGTKYYYKVRGFVVIDGQKYYTDWSLKAIRTVK